MSEQRRQIEWAADSKDVLRGFPDGIKWIFGRAIFSAEMGSRHEIASPMKGRLRGIVEIADGEQGCAYRLYYTLKCPGWIYVLYCHMKKSKRGIGIPKHEDDLIFRRYRDAMIDCRRKQEEAE